MSDSADRFARLKSLQSGLKTRSAPPSDDGGDLPTLDSVLEGGGASGAGSETDGESLSAYFEALGLVPGDEDGAVDGATGAPPEPYTPTSASYGDSAPVDSRPVDARDRWADPVREDDAYLSSFSGANAPKETETGEPVAEEEEAFEAAPAEGEADPVEDVPSADAEASGEDIPADAPTTEAVLVMEDATEEPSLAGDTLEQVGPDETPDFGTDIDIEAFEREIAQADESKARRTAFDADEEAGAEPAPEASPPDEEPLDEASVADLAGDSLSVAFDASRAETLEQVSRQMGCSVDDVVITAVDWYLDALFGEDGSMNEAAAE